MYHSGEGALKENLFAELVTTVTATDILRDEHRLIMLSLAILANISDRLDNNDHVDSADLAELVTFYRVFADKVHHAKEEDILFQAMTENGVPDDEDLIGSLLLEHTLGRAFVDMMADSVTTTDGQSSIDAAEFSEAARGFVLLLSQHICKEDHTLYPLAEKHLSEQEQLEISAACAGIDSERSLSDDSARTKAMLDRLRVEYGASEQILACCP